MFLPESEKPIYSKNPLETVICQLRFPPILRIETETPSLFQEAIRAEYPMFVQKPLMGGLPKGMSEVLAAATIKIGGVGGALSSYDFSSADHKWVVSLTKEWISLTCRSYTRWAEFMNNFGPPIEAFQRQYSPAFYQRIGLRYRNVIQRSKIGLQDSSWSDLLRQDIAGVLASSSLGKLVEQYSSDFVLRSESGIDRVHFQHGLGKKANNTEVVYVLDLDIYTGKRTEIKDANKKLDDFNIEAAKLFRWCITDRLHQALEPA